MRGKVFHTLSSLSLLISDFGLKMREMQLFLSLEYLEAINWPNFITVLSQEMRKPEEREREGERPN